MVVVESSRRKSCQEVWQALEGFSEKCTSDPAYVEDRSPWCASSVTAEPFTHSVDVDLEGEAQRVVAENRSSLPVHTGHSESDSVSFS
jgi:hypothetical protein